MNRQEKAQIMGLCDYGFRFLDQFHLTVQSMSNRKINYIVTLMKKAWPKDCTCPDNSIRGNNCKHMIFTDNLVSTI